MAGMFRSLVRLLLNSSVRDTQCGFKLFRRDVAHRLFAQSMEDGFLFDLEILGLADRQKIAVREVSVDWHEVPGSKIREVPSSKIRLFRDSWRMFVGLFRIRRRISNGCEVVAQPSDNVASMSRCIEATVGIRPAA